jgi:hypothetical protein
MRFKRTNGQDYGFDLCRDKLLELFPVDIVHRLRGMLLGPALVGRSSQKEVMRVRTII